MECTIKETRGELKTERQIAFANALKALDEDKELNEMYENALREIGRDLFDMTDEDFKNNEVKSVENAKS